MMCGYLGVNRSKEFTDTPNQVKLYLHRMIAFTFVPGYKEGYVVNHIDGCKMNNRADNLEWVSAEENVREKYNPRRKYDQEFIDELYDTMRTNHFTTKDLGRRYNIQQSYMSKLLLNNLHSKDVDVIKQLYNSNVYSIAELSSIYNVKEVVIKNIVK